MSQPDTPMDDVTVFLNADLVDAIEGQLEYGDSRSEWIREAVRQRLANERTEQ